MPGEAVRLHRQVAACLLAQLALGNDPQLPQTVPHYRPESLTTQPLSNVNWYVLISLTL